MLYKVKKADAPLMGYPLFYFIDISIIIPLHLYSQLFYKDKGRVRVL